MKTTKFICVALPALIMLASCSSDEQQLLYTSSMDEGVGTSTIIPLNEAIDQAKEVVLAISSSNGKSTRSSEMSVRNVEIYSSGPATRSSSTSPSFYFINFTDDKGFAVVPADTRLPSDPVAFSDEGTISISDTTFNKGLKLFIETLPNPEDCLLTKAISDGDAVQTIYTIDKIVPPILSPSVQKWTQYAPFNKYCPSINGANCVVGCPAMAMGMVLSAFKYPASIEGYTLPWDDMNSGNNDDNVARMLSLIGGKQYLEIDYGVNASGLTFLDIEGRIGITLTSLGYNSPVNNRGYINEEDMINSLEAGSPILLIGSAIKGKNDKIGHVWNIDGYGKYAKYIVDSWGNKSLSESGGYYFHCVWGWGGKSNGYYKCFNLGTDYAGIGGTTRFGDDGNYNTTYEFNEGITISVPTPVYIYHSFSHN